MLAQYNADLGLDDAMIAELLPVARDVVPQGFLREATAVAAQLDVRVEDVLAGNLHYDVLKVLLGCTAFAVETPEGPLHARNLDWWTEDRVLADTSLVCRFEGAAAGPFTTVGWPGFLGAFSGVAPGRFAVTLNAVLSADRPHYGLPVVILLRRVLEEEPDFEAAVERLSTTEIVSDCLLLVTGVAPGERVVLERTPTRCAARWPAGDAPLQVTNDYRVLDAPVGEGGGAIVATSCGRYERIAELLETDPPRTFDHALAHLSDDGVRMAITVQQMAFRAATGEMKLAIP